jgi:hypothetical protein
LGQAGVDTREPVFDHSNWQKALRKRASCKANMGLNGRHQWMGDPLKLGLTLCFPNTDAMDGKSVTPRTIQRNHHRHVSRTRPNDCCSSLDQTIERYALFEARRPASASSEDWSIGRATKRADGKTLNAVSTVQIGEYGHQRVGEICFSGSCQHRQ